MEKDYITISEAAAIAGVSTQAIYKRLTTSLQPYVATVNGRKMIHINAMAVLSPTIDNQPPTTNDSKFTNGYQPTQHPDITSELLQTITNTLEALQSQIETRDRQISELTALLDKALNSLQQVHYIIAQNNRLEAPKPEPPEEPPKPPEEPKRPPWYKRIFK